MSTPSRARPLELALVAALGTALLTAGPVLAQDNEVDEAVQATGDVISDVAGAISDTASEATEEVATSATWDRIAGNWKQFSGAAKARWGELTDDDMDRIEGNREQLVGEVQERYGITRMEAQAQVDEWADEQ